MDIEALMRPFEGSQVRQRTGPGRKPLDYVSGPDVMRRLLDATGNHFSWSVEKVQLVPVETQNGQSFLWLVLGTLTVGEFGSRSGVGTHPADGVEAAKAAETDALKRAAVKFGVGLHLHEDEAGQGVIKGKAVGVRDQVSPTPAAHSAPMTRGGSAAHGGSPCGGNRNTPFNQQHRTVPNPDRVGNGYSEDNNHHSDSNRHGDGSHNSGTNGTATRNGYVGMRRNNAPSYAGENPNDGVGENAPF